MLQLILRCWIRRSKYTYRLSPSSGCSNMGYSNINFSSLAINILIPSISDLTIMEDLNLVQEMTILGLPMSFTTNKEKRKTGTGRKKKGKLSHKKLASGQLNLCSEPIITVIDHQCSYGTEATSRDQIIERERGRGSCDIATGKLAVSVGPDVLAEHYILEDQLSSNVNDEASEPGIDNIHEEESTHLVHSIVVTHPITMTSANNDSVSVDDADDGSRCRSLFDYNLKNITSEKSSYFLNSSRDCKNEHELEVSESCLSDSIQSIQLPMVGYKGTKCKNCTCSEDLSSWMVVWDAFYMTNYYYNIVTEESTWSSPLCKECTTILLNSNETSVGGMGQNIACSIFDNSCADRSQSTGEIIPSVQHEIDSICSDGKPFHATETSHHLEKNAKDSIESEAIVLSDEDYAVSLQALALANNSESVNKELDVLSCVENSRSTIMHTSLAQIDNDLDVVHSSASCKKKKKKKGIKLTEFQQKMKCENRDNIILPEEMERFSSDIVKYWCQRYVLFSKFDSGVKMDEEGWFSVTPEVIARHHAVRCGNGAVIDCFAGVGGNTIQFAMKGCHVIAIDIDPCKIDYARHNATIYGVQDNIDFIQGDFFQLASKLKGDAVFLSPPWGGPDYLKAEVYDLQTMLKPHNGYVLFRTAHLLAPKVVMFLPRNVHLNQLVELSQSVDPPWELEVEKNYLNGKLKAITAYFRDPLQ